MIMMFYDAIIDVLFLSLKELLRNQDGSMTFRRISRLRSIMESKGL